MAVKMIRGLTGAEYEEIKIAVKSLGFSASVRRHHHHVIDIRPTKKLGYRFSPEHISAITELCHTYHLTDTMGYIGHENSDLIFHTGFDYLYKTCN